MNNISGDKSEVALPQDKLEVSSVGAKNEEAKPENNDAEHNILPKISPKSGEINPEIQTDNSRSAVATAIQDDSSSVSTVSKDDDDSQSQDAKSTQKIEAGASPEIADDIDLIEKEWVEKAKEIVNQTKDDPRQQNIALGKMKADYLKKRFNKTINIDTGT